MSFRKKREYGYKNSSMKIINLHFTAQSAIALLFTVHSKKVYFHAGLPSVGPTWMHINVTKLCLHD